VDGKPVYLSSTEVPVNPSTPEVERSWSSPMYETEVNNRIESSSDIPIEVIQEFGKLKGKVQRRTTLNWSEHCTECVWPVCYSTCDLYSPREDGKCRRFIDGMARVDCSAAINSYLLKIKFKRWGKLWSPGNVRLHSAGVAERIERRDYQIGTALYQLPIPAGLKRAVTSKRYSLKKKSASRPTDAGDSLPTAFLLECYNPQSFCIRISLTMRPVSEGGLPFQELVELVPGFNRIRVPMNDIARVLNPRMPFSVELIPNDVLEGTTLYFGLMEFVREVEQQFAEKIRRAKCVIWDLDNTLWDGVLVEDGLDNLKLKADALGTIKTLDARGILQSVASKNNYEEAMQAIKHFELDEYFLFPQISWRPKSEGIDAIARQLNIGIDTLVFVDDSKFELEQVRGVYPEVRVVNALDAHSLLEMKECQVPVTAESKDRRKMYKIEAERRNIGEGFGNDYTAFLRHCEIRLSIQPLTQGNIDRVHELTQRTNQMNFSGQRYDRDVLRDILTKPYLSTYVLSCEDRFGSYGIIGFSIVDSREPRMTDLMFSCRIQSKRVEHAFLTYIIRNYIRELNRDFFANYCKTSRNAPSGKVFCELNMEEVGVSAGVTSLVFRKNREIPDDGVITIIAAEVPLSRANS
jgi:FkbH-like protein